MRNAFHGMSPPRALRRCLLLAFSLALVLALFASCGAGERRFQTQRIGYFDSFVLFIGYARTEAEFTRHADAVFEKIGELHRLFDIFTPTENAGSLYELNANAGIAPITPAPEVMALLLAATEAYDQTNGAVNIALGPVLRIWHEYRTQAVQDPDNARLPPFEALTHAAHLTDISRLHLDAENNTAFLQEAGMSVDVGAIAKGFAAKRVMQALREAGITAALLNLGGQVSTLGTAPGRTGWEVGIQGQESILFTDATLSVSGGGERFMEVSGQRFGHIIDPATLMPATQHAQLAVLHTCPLMADVLSTALFILPKDEGQKLAQRFHAQVFWGE